MPQAVTQPDAAKTISSRARLEPREREAMILECMPLVYAIARRLAGSLSSEVSLEDLVSAGTVGLIHAVDNFEVAQAVKLETYAAHRIRGAMLDSVRANDSIPRRQRAHLKRLQEGMAKAQAKYQRIHVTDEEVAAELGSTVDEYRESLASLPVTKVVSLEESGALAENVTESQPGATPCEILERAEMTSLLNRALDRLPGEEQTLLSLYYSEGMAPQEIAIIMNLPVKRVYQLKAQAILRLRAALERRLLRKPKS